MNKPVVNLAYPRKYVMFVHVPLETLPVAGGVFFWSAEGWRDTGFQMEEEDGEGVSGRIAGMRIIIFCSA